MMKAIGLELLGYQKIEGTIKCKTGLRIGGGGETIEIGGLDNPVIKHPISQHPYIPGSSIKGKMRSLLELKLNKIGREGEVHQYKEDECGFDCPVCRIFGVAAGAGSPFGPGRLIVRDARLESLEGQVEDNLTQTEIKWENVVNRIRGSAEHPRQMERVPAGAEFSFEMNYRVFNAIDQNGKGDEGKVDLELFGYVLKGLKLLEMDTLGGSGSRGYGKIDFGTVTVTYLDGSIKEIPINEIAL